MVMRNTTTLVYDIFTLERRLDDIREILCRIAVEMGIRTHYRQTKDIAADIERYIQCSRYTKLHNPTGVLTPWP